MLPEESSVAKDQYGCIVIDVTGENLENFPALISWIRQRGYGRDTGLLKLRLCPADRNDAARVKQITTLMKRAFKEKEWDEDSNTFQFAYRPSVEIAHKRSPDHHIYQYVKVECTDEERKMFVKHSVQPLSYKKQDTCCTAHVTSGDLDHLRHHIFSQLENSSPRLEDDLHKSTSSATPPIYGDGIVLDKDAKVFISNGFSLSSNLDTLLCHLDEKFDGIACPFFYSGNTHTLFPWHIEDGGLFSINYIFAGAPKFWFGISPDYFGLIDKIASGMQIDLAHSSCRALLVDHKVLVADPGYFREHHQVPFTQVIQEPGEFIVTLPYGLHAGFNLGKNLAVAANFADVPWIEWGIYTPICTCNLTQIHFDLSGVLKEFRPDLLDIYGSNVPLVYPRTHPREVRYPAPAIQENNTEVSDDSCVDDPAIRKRTPTMQPKKYFKSTPRIKDRTLYCPDCKQSFQGNKLARLKLHIRKQHFSNCDKLWRDVEIRYPSWKPKMNKGLLCTVCKKFIIGGKSNLRTHISAMHLK